MAAPLVVGLLARLAVRANPNPPTLDEQHTSRVLAMALAEIAQKRQRRDSAADARISSGAQASERLGQPPAIARGSRSPGGSAALTWVALIND